MTYNFITRQIAVGQKIDSAQAAEDLKATGITAVINLFSGNAEEFWKGPVLTLVQEDDGTPRPADQVRSGVAYALEAIGNGGKIYIHCQWGLGRGPAMCYAVLRKLGLSGLQAIELIESKRPACASWNWKLYIPSIEAALWTPQ